MSEQMLPDRPDELSFSRSFLGYDPLEVRAFIADMNAQLEQLRVRGGRLPTGNGAPDDNDLAVAIDSAVSDISDVLEAARAAAQKIRERSEHEGADSLAAAVVQARKLLVSAESEAYALRKAAWETSTELLESVKAEHAKQRAASERKALEIISNAERNAHRKLAAARRDSENALQTAASESDRMIEQARTKGQEILRAAEDRAESANERASVLERRYEELFEEVESLEFRLQGPPTPPAQTDLSSTTVKVIHPAEGPPVSPGSEETDSAARGGAFQVAQTSPQDRPVGVRSQNVGWADGTDSVRLVQTPAVQASVEVDALELADEVARLGEAGTRVATMSESGREPDTKPPELTHHQERRLEQKQYEPPPAPKVVYTAPPTRNAGYPEPTVPSRLPPASFSRPEPEPEEAASAASSIGKGREADELGDLFLKLRMKNAVTAGADPPNASNPVLSAAERYDRLLLPIINRTLRAVKRQLIDIQREQIEGLEADTEGRQPRSGLSSSLVHLISVMEREAADQGLTAAAEMTGARVAVMRGEAPAEGGESFLTALFDDVSQAVLDARGAGLAGRELAGAATRVYRAWRTGEAERRLRFLAGRAYHHGLMRSLGEAGVGEYRIEVNEGCGECGPLAGAVLPRDQVPTVPIHSECRCMVIPA